MRARADQQRIADLEQVVALQGAELETYKVQLATMELHLARLVRANPLVTVAKRHRRKAA